MLSDAYKVLGEARINEICKNFEFNDDDKNKIDKVLREWDYILGDQEKKNNVLFEIIGNNSNLKKIIKAIFLISCEFAQLAKPEKNTEQWYMCSVFLGE